MKLIKLSFMLLGIIIGSISCGSNGNDNSQDKNEGSDPSVEEVDNQDIDVCDVDCWDRPPGYTDGGTQNYCEFPTEDEDNDGIKNCYEFECYKYKSCCSKQEEDLIDLSRCLESETECAIFSNNLDKRPKIHENQNSVSFTGENPYQFQFLTQKEPLRISGPFEINFKIIANTDSIIGVTFVDSEIWRPEFSSDIIPQWGVLVDNITKSIAYYQNGHLFSEENCVVEENNSCQFNGKIALNYDEPSVEQPLQGNISITNGNDNKIAGSFLFDRNYYLVLFGYGSGEIQINNSSYYKCMEISNWKYYDGHRYILPISWNRSYNTVSTLEENQFNYILFGNGFQIYLLKLNSECDPNYLSSCNAILSLREVNLPPLPQDTLPEHRYGEVTVRNPLLIRKGTKYYLFYIGEREQNNKKGLLVVTSSQPIDGDGTEEPWKFEYINNKLENSILLEEEKISNYQDCKIYDFDVVKSTQNEENLNLYVLAKENTGKAKVLRIKLRFENELLSVEQPQEFIDTKDNKGASFDISNTKQLEVESQGDIYYLWLVMNQAGEDQLYIGESSNGKEWYIYSEPVFMKNKYISRSEEISWMSILYNSTTLKRYLYILTSEFILKPLFQDVILTELSPER